MNKSEMRIFFPPSHGRRDVAKRKQVYGPWRSAWQLQLVRNWHFFCRHVSKTHCCRLNRLKSWVNCHTVPHYARINLHHFRHFNLDLSRSLKVTCDGGIRLPIYDFLLVFNIVTYGLTQLLISLRDLSDLNIYFQGHSMSDVMVSLDSPYMVSYWYM